MEIWLFITCYILISSDIVHIVHMYIILSVASLHNSLLHYICTCIMHKLDCLSIYIHLFYQLLHDIIRKICFVNVNLNIYLKNCNFFCGFVAMSLFNHNFKSKCHNNISTASAPYILVITKCHHLFSNSY